MPGRHTKKKSRSQLRLERIWKRQRDPAWLNDYVPATLATRAEAPRISNATQFSPYNRLGRTLHALSSTEEHAIVLALYSPRVFDLHEQKMLHPFPSPHPLAEHPDYKGGNFPRLEGTVAVAKRLGHSSWHSKVRVTLADGQTVLVPNLYENDLLLYLTDHAGNPYCRNWTVKHVSEAFERPAPSERMPKNPERASARSVIRHTVEREYFADAGIDTQRVTAADFEPTLMSNLRQCMLSDARLRRLGIEIPEHVLGLFHSLLDSRISPQQLQRHCALRESIPPSEFRLMLFSAIWRRRLRVDLFSPLLFDHAWVAERTDVLDVYRRWFDRS